jgi:hypothetical protein
MFCEEPTLRVEPHYVKVSRNEKHTSLQQHRSWFKTILKLEANVIKTFFVLTYEWAK